MKKRRLHCVSVRLGSRGRGAGDDRIRTAASADLPPSTSFDIVLG